MDHIVDILVNGDGVQFYAIQKAGDMYSSIDLIIDKMAKQISSTRTGRATTKPYHEMVEKIDLETRVWTCTCTSEQTSRKRRSRPFSK